MNSPTYETLFAQLDAHPESPSLSPRQPLDAALSDAIQNSDLSPILKCGMLIWNGDYQTAHPIAQALESADGSYWHAIIHRMEADYWNAKYWFKQVSNQGADHAVLRMLGTLPEAKPFLIGGKWSPAAFVDACERVAGQSLNDELLRKLQRIEIKALLTHCHG